MARNLLLALGLLVAAAVVGYLALDGGGGGLEEPEIALAAGGPEEAVDSVEPSRPLELAPVPAEEEAALTSSTPEDEREAVAVIASEGTILLRILGPDEQPVAGARVWVLEDDGVNTRAHFFDSSRIDALLEERGDVQQASSAGELSIPRPGEGGILVAARKDELWGSVRISSGDKSEYALQLEPDRSLRVQVVDERGEPQGGVDVQVQSVRSGWANAVALGRTGEEDGTATFHHVQRELREFFPWQLDSAGETPRRAYRVAIDALTEEIVAEDLEGSSFDGEPIVLVLPPTGSVRLQVFDESWEAYGGEAQASLEVVPEGDSREASPFSARRRHETEVTVEDGVAIFPLVGLGLEVGASVRRTAHGVPTRAYAAGPTRAGETVSIDVQLGADHPVARLRAMDGRGKPLGNESIACEIQIRSYFLQNTSKTQLRTDAEGYFLVDVDNDWSEGTQRTLIVTRGKGKEPRPSGSVDLSRSLQTGINELGDVVLEEPVVLVAGRVQTEAGEPIAGAELALRSRRDEGERWDEHWSFSHKAASDGSFEVREEVAGVAFQLAAERPGFAGGWVSFVRGDGNVVVVLRAQGEIEGRVLLDEGVPDDIVRMSIQDLDDGVEHLDYSHRSVKLEDDGSFRFTRLMPGKRHVSLRANRQSGNLMEFEDVQVVSGEVTRDPRLQEIDLRGLYHLHRLEIVGTTTGERLNGSLRFGPAGAEELDDQVWLGEPQIEILTEHRSIDLEIAASGYRVEFLRDFSGKGELRLRKGLEVTLVLTGDAPIPKPPVFVKATLVPEEGDDSMIDWSAGAFDERRETKASVAQAGRMKVRWVLERRSGGSSIATSVDLEREQFVEILDVEGGQRVEIDLTPEEMQQIVDRLP